MAIVPDDASEDEDRDTPPSPAKITISVSTGEAFIEGDDGERILLWRD